jgi:cell wall-associated NlpC family hydrolase
MTPAEHTMRARIIEEAKSWIGTPYRSAADVKQAGVDCGMLLVRIYVDTGILPAFDPRPYPEQWHVHQAEERYLGWVRKFAQEISGGPGEKLPGDVVLFKYGKCYSHGAIVVEWPVIIHVRRPNPVLPEDAASSGMLAKLEKRYFSVWPR